ncbi:hypothetical protein HF329_20650 [Chitinophaga oryzae]|uniref:Uncharacterized protein n=1 Tax=Chitinophaga oryzae TaxID=2725414 RepID=A0AAE6ZI11_9BACT|nr:hypothetical protein [Chitinophaga oryzae]QJB33591.1 hypothetical protein HF329_20650 [Chitinophaga oryzae]
MNQRPCALYCAIIAVLLLPACLKPGPIIVPPGHPTARIIQLKELDPLYSDSSRVAYNQPGNPVSITPSSVSTGYPMWLFRYDNQHRLIASVGAYDNGLNMFEMAHRYVLNAAGRIISDTTFVFGTFDTTVTPLRITGQGVRTTSYNYDSYSRITQTVTTDLVPDIPRFRTTVNYSYNNTGNAWKIVTIRVEIPYPHAIPDTSITYPVYDNKPNFHRLHPVWQFVDRDYNTNNPGNAISYDTYGLATEMQPNTNILGIFYHRGAIRYEYRP